MFKVHQVKVHILGIPKCPHSITIVKILGSQKCALLHDAP